MGEIAEPIPALQSDLRDIYDRHCRSNDVVLGVSLPRTLHDQLAATVIFFLPATCSAWELMTSSRFWRWVRTTGCPRHGQFPGRDRQSPEVFRERQERWATLGERRDDVFDDVDASLQSVTHPEVNGFGAGLHPGVDTHRAGLLR
ncbi:hypothetical protein PZB75_00015 [Streptomyces sp. AM 4-1-1]|uniref:hypothetical protein n=1 Tax=Streptomyces sp. AM 4-1-1 TaxID=3028710 RepID=UPI0023BA2E41|nr:hypothetical protein [Streptomyces sp. AM 4-1-1]WEH31906.1 hypothetical protein PZB75_00015 [Streptomyces sp. AM 4-1-1]